jgi:hypothetical protein
MSLQPGRQTSRMVRNSDLEVMKSLVERSYIIIQNAEVARSPDVRQDLWVNESEWKILNLSFML